ncbi:MAG: GDSL-type esterase/lipase family protein [Crocinitomicaceae bacterium]|nr:GDSL-type esterase/lipase family protein [Crocinitomicaceae bacterium]
MFKFLQEQKYWVSVLLFGAIISSYAQKQQPLNHYSYPDFIRQDTALCSIYDFVDFSKNNYAFYTEDSPNFEYLYHQMDSMIRFQDRKLNFYHIGGSHVQADIYTNDIRMFLQTNFTGLPGERGWVFPLNLAGTNNPGSYRFSSPSNFRGYRIVGNKDKTIDFGTMGVTVISSDSVVQLSFEHKYTVSKPGFCKVRIFHNKGELPYELNFGDNEILIADVVRNYEIGYTEIEFTDKIDSMNLQFVRTIPQRFELEIYGFQFLNEDPGISYNTIGVNGAGLYSYLDCARFEEQLKTYPPDFFAFSVGTNDANVPYDHFKPEVYKANLEKIMNIVLRANPNCALLLTVPNDAYYRRKSLNKNVAREREMIIELAKKYKMAVWDFYGVMGELGSSKTWMKKSLMRTDLVHFTAPGYHFKGDLFIDGFLKYLLQMREYFDTSTSNF